MHIANGKIYDGTSNYTSDILANINKGRVYRGTSNYTSDMQFHFDGPLTIEEFVAVYFAVKYIF
jgi:hypothetical protein